MIKTFENWVSDATSNVTVNYGDKEPVEIPKYSEIVKYTVEYIERNFSKITKIDLVQLFILFKDTEEKIRYIQLKISDYTFGERYYISYTKDSDRGSDIDITKEEFDYLLDFFKKIEFKLRKVNQTSVHDDILNTIDPLRKDAKKYNL